MKAILGAGALIVVVVAIVIAVVLGTSGTGYQVRGIFDHAGYLIPGEDVRVAGVKVGSIASVELTPQNKAAIVMNITDPGFEDFRSDASCLIRPQSLLGEKYIDCKLTQSRPPGAPLPAPLATISKGPNAGQHLLPLAQTGKSVDIDLVTNIMRRPYAERLSLIINELGTGLAGRGSDLGAVLRRADPALQSLDRFMKVLSGQNEALAQLAQRSDAVLAPLGANAQRIAGFTRNAGAVAQATLKERAQLAATLKLLPHFLSELRPTMQRLGAFAQQTTPVIEDLQAVAPSINKLIEETAPFARAGTPAVKALGKAAETGTTALPEAQNAFQQLTNFGRAIKPVGATLAPLLQSLNKTGGIKNLMDFAFYSTSSLNGFDSFGHYLRAGLIVNTCSSYSISPSTACLSKYSAKTKASSVTSGASARPVTSTTVTPAPRGNAWAKDDPDLELLDYLLGGDER